MERLDAKPMTQPTPDADLREVIARAACEASIAYEFGDMPENDISRATWDNSNQEYFQVMADAVMRAVMRAVAATLDPGIEAAIERYGGAMYMHDASAKESLTDLRAMIAVAGGRRLALRLTTSLPPEREVRARILLAVNPRLRMPGAVKIVDRVIDTLIDMGALNMEAFAPPATTSGEG